MLDGDWRADITHLEHTLTAGHSVTDDALLPQLPSSLVFYTYLAQHLSCYASKCTTSSYHSQYFPIAWEISTKLRRHSRSQRARVRGRNHVFIFISMSERGKFASLHESGNYFARVLLNHSDPAQHLDGASSGLEVSSQISR